jgi:hypothetical protein
VVVAFGGNGNDGYSSAVGAHNFISAAARGAMGVTVYSFSYPGYDPNGGWTSETTVTEGANGLVDFVKEAYPSEPLVIWGWSMGSAVALASVSQQPSHGLACVMLGVPWTTLWAEVMHHTFYLASPWIWVADRWPSTDRARGVHAPTLVLSATQDAVIPPKMHRAIYNAIPALGKMLLEEAVDHNGVRGFNVTGFFETSCIPRILR